MVMLVKHWKVKNRIPMSLYSTPYTYRHRMNAVFDLQFASISHAQLIFEKKMCHCVIINQIKLCETPTPEKAHFGPTSNPNSVNLYNILKAPKKYAIMQDRGENSCMHIMTLNNEWMKKKDRSKSRRLMRLTEMQCIIKEIHMKVEHSKWSTRSTAH